MDAGNPTITPLRVDPRQRYFTTIQPFSYRDTLTVLHYVQDIAANVDALREQLDNLAKDEEADINGINKIIEQIGLWRSSVDTALDDLMAKVDRYQTSALTYNPTTGRYEDSENTDRDMYRELAVFGARVGQMATVTAAQAAQHDCITWAILGNREIFGHEEPRVTPRGRTERQ